MTNQNVVQLSIIIALYAIKNVIGMNIKMFLMYLNIIMKQKLKHMNHFKLNTVMLKVQNPKHNRFFKVFLKSLHKITSNASSIKNVLGNALINYSKLL